MSTCTKQIGVVVVGCPPAGTAPSFTLGWNVYIASVPVEFQTDFLHPDWGICVFPRESVWRCYADSNSLGFGGLDPLSDYVNAICPINVTGSAPITYSIVDGSLPSGFSLDTVTGYITGISDDVTEIGDVFTFKIRASNACGVCDSDQIVMFVGTYVYFGEWVPPEPTSFSATDILVNMTNVYPNGASPGPYTESGPRYFPGHYSIGPNAEYLTSWGIQWFELMGAEFQFDSLFAWIRVIAIPDTFFSGTNQNPSNPRYSGIYFTQINSVDNRFTYKETINLSVNGDLIPYRIYTTAATIDFVVANAYP